MQVLHKSCSWCTFPKDSNEVIFPGPERKVGVNQPLAGNLGQLSRRVTIADDKIFPLELSRVPSAGSSARPSDRNALKREASDALKREDTEVLREDEGDVDGADDLTMSQELAGSLVREMLGSYDVSFLNNLIELLWPLINRALAKFVRNRMVPMLQEELPVLLKQTTVSKFDLGRRLPTITSLKLHRRSKGVAGTCSEPALEATVFFTFTTDSTARMELNVAGRHRATIESLSVKGEVSCLLRPLLDEIPVVGGVTLFALDPPKVDVHFGGISHILDSAVLAKTVHRVIDTCLASQIVLPNVLARPFGTAQQGVDNSFAKARWPEGILCIRPLRAAGIQAHDWRFVHCITCPSTGNRATGCLEGLAKVLCCNPYSCFFKPSSDSYVHVAVGETSWRSAAVQGTLNPVWTSLERGYLPVFDKAQKVWMDVREGLRHRNALLGRVRPLSVSDALMAAEANFELFAPTGRADGLMEAKGAIWMNFDWMQVTPKKEGTEGHVLAVKLDSLRIMTTSQVLPHRVAVRVKVDSFVKTTDFMTTRSSGTGSMALVAFQTTIFMCLPGYGLQSDTVHRESQDVEVQVVDHSWRLVASTRVSWSSLKSAPNFRYPQSQPDGGLGGVSLTGSGLEAYLTTQLCLAGMTLPSGGTESRRLANLSRQQARTFSPHKRRDWTQEWLPTSRKADPKRRATVFHAPTDPEAPVEWLNACLSELWPRINLALENVAHQRLMPMISEALPSIAAQGLKLKEFTLGSKPPTLLNLRMRGQRISSGALEALATVDFQAMEPRVDISFLGAGLRFRQISCRGELHCRMVQLQEEGGVVGGLVFFFLDAPKIELETDASNAVEKAVHQWMFMKRVRQALDAALMKLLVLPHVFALPISSVNVAELRKPPPLGVLRVLAFRLRNEGHEGSIEIFSGAVECFLRFGLGDVCWETPNVRVTSNLVWKKPEHNNFMVYDPEQKLTVDVCRTNGQAVIGSMEPITVFHAAERQDVHLPLYPPDILESLEAAQAAGTPQDPALTERAEADTWGEVTLRLQWFRLLPCKAGEDEWCAVSVRIHAIHLPHRLGHEAAVSTKIAEETWISRYGAPQPRSPLDTHDAGVNVLRVDTIHYGFARKADIMANASVEFTVVGSTQQRLAHASVPLKRSWDAPNMTHPGPSEPPELVEFKLLNGVSEGLSHMLVQLTVSLLGLQPERGYLESDMTGLRD